MKRNVFKRVIALVLSVFIILANILALPENNVRAAELKTITLDATVRDFRPDTNPDFEKYSSGLMTGLVKTNLAPDNKPELVSFGGSLPITSKESFNQWFNDVEGININLPYSLAFVGDGSGNYVFNNATTFLPIDGKGFGNYSTFGHNFSFTMEGHGQFVYKGTESITVTGDDDIWLFINNQLAIDLGGVHGTQTKSIPLDPAHAANLGLQIGQKYQFDLFFAERHTSLSNLKIQTNFEFIKAPTVPDYSVITNEDEAVTGTVVGSDENGDTLTYSKEISPAHGTAIVNSNGTWNYTPNANYNGTDSFKVKVSDVTAETTTSAISITVNSVQDPPTVPDYSIGTQEDTPVWGTVVGTDADNDTLNYSQLTNPAHGTATVNSDGNWTYTPVANYNSIDSFTVEVNDGNGVTTTSAINITVSPVNDPPTVPNYSVTIKEDEPVDGTVVGADIDKDTLTYTKGSVPKNGTATVASNGTWTYTPNANYNGTDGFSIVVSDGNETTTSNITVDIISENDSIVTNTDTATVLEDEIVNINVKANDTDIDGDSLTVTQVGTAGHGTVSLNTDQTVKYEPTYNYNGTDSFTYTINDGTTGSAIGTVNVTVTSVNDSPVANADTATVLEDEIVNIGVKANDADADGDSLTVIQVGTAGHGKTEINADGTVKYTPTANYIGTDTFTYTISDGTTGAAIGTVKVTVNSVNDSPVANADTATVLEDESVNIDVKANDTDVDGDSLTVTQVGTAGHGKTEINAAGTVKYTPTANYIGTDTFTYTISDGTIGVAIGTVNVTITAKPKTSTSSASSVNSKPTVSDYKESTEVDKQVSGVAKATDVDNDNLTYELSVQPQIGTVRVKNTGEWTYTPKNGYVGEDVFTVKVSDGRGGTAVSKITITVEDISVNDLAVVINVDKFMIEENSKGTFTITYYNKLENEVKNVSVSATIPEGATASNYGKGVLDGNTLTWTLDKLGSKGKGNITFDKIDVSQKKVNVEAEITSKGKEIVSEDNKSMISVLVYSNRFNTIHTKYLSGYTDGTFKPDKSISREEIATIFAKILDLKASGEEDKQIYKDVKSDSWAAGYIEAVTTAKLFTGSADGKFNPKAPITRAELATVIAKYLKVAKAKGIVLQEYHYTDIEGHWAANNIEEILRLGVKLNDNSNKFEPNKKVTRQEVVVFLNRMLGRGPLYGVNSKWKDVTKATSGYSDILEATISHESIINEDLSEQYKK